MLFPWNIYITAQSYYAHRFEHTPDERLSRFGSRLGFKWRDIVGLGIAVYYGHKFNMRFSVAVPMVINALVLMATTALVNWLQSRQDVFLITCGSVVICGLHCPPPIGDFGLAGRFPNVYMQAVMSGQGMSGISVSLISIFSTLAEPAGTKNLSFADVQESAFFYFLVATIVIVVTLFAFNLMSHLDFAQYYAFADTQWENVNRTAGHKTIGQKFPARSRASVSARYDAFAATARRGGGFQRHAFLSTEHNGITRVQQAVFAFTIASRKSVRKSEHDSKKRRLRRDEHTRWKALMLHMERRSVCLFCILFDPLCFSRPNLRNSLYKESRQC